MSTPEYDTGVIQALLERLNNQRLPAALEMKEKVDRGETLSNFDLANLDANFAHSSEIKPLLDRHPEYMTLVTKIANLYNEILTKAVENEKKAQG